MEIYITNRVKKIDSELIRYLITIPNDTITKGKNIFNFKTENFKINSK